MADTGQRRALVGGLDFNFYHVLPDEVAGRQDHYHSINALPQYRHLSFEELRVGDSSNSPALSRSPSTDNHFTSKPPKGLALAIVPRSPSSFEALTTRRTLAMHILSLGGATITFRVGKDDPEDFAVHECLATANSEFVRLAMSKDWKEARERVIPLPADSPETFALYQNFLYSGNIASNNCGDEKNSEEYQLLVHAYILGERFLDSTFKNAVVDAIIFAVRSSGFFDLRLTDLIYDNTPAGSQLRRLLQDIYIWAGSPGWLDEEATGAQVNADFLLDLSKILLKAARIVASPDPPYTSRPCFYHEHEQDSGPCQRGAATLPMYKVHAGP